MRCILLFAVILGVGSSTATLAQVHSTLDTSLPGLPQIEKGPDDPNATYCRPPQLLPDSRFMGPKVCMTNRQWDVLHSKGLEISADGKNTVTCRRASVAADPGSKVMCYKGPLP